MFPETLYNMLEEVSLSSDEASIVSWMPHGRAFRVHKPKKFVSTIMVHKFRQTKWPSFQRQLHLYGFRRITQGVDKGAYYHESFIRGYREITRTMTFSRVKGTKVRKAEIPVRHLEPNFYNLPPLPSPTATITTENDSNAPTTETSPIQPVGNTCMHLTSSPALMKNSKNNTTSRISLSRCSLIKGDFLDMSDNVKELEDMFSDEEETPANKDTDIHDIVPKDDDAWLRQSLLSVNNTALTEAMQQAQDDYQKRDSLLPQDANEWASTIEQIFESQDSSSSAEPTSTFLTTMLSL
mmetsp:Transcript_7970/g.11442  ORF Transcript_7970/g.11442 Transcript_7970/m.11442 type:complete len:295 (-) Transcript_7970:46-930(-)